MSGRLIHEYRFPEPVTVRAGETLRLQWAFANSYLTYQVTKEKALEGSDINCELWREYDFGGRVYRIVNPQVLYMRPGGTTHRVLDAEGVVHCVPAPGQQGCVLRWQPRDPLSPCQF